jgi:YidC/Oxa1 family membrane protein insertase
VLDPLYRLVAAAIVFFHGALSPIFGKDNFWSWALAIVLLTMVVRLILFPLFVKQIKSQRTMQMLQPRIKELRDKYKNDKQRMNMELMALQKEHGNPLLGCLPIFAQIPLFIALFHVLRALQPHHTTLGVCKDLAKDGYILHQTSGLTCSQVQQFANAKLFGVSLSASFRSPAAELHYLGANATAVRIMAAILIVIMAVTTYLTQKQIMGRNGPVDPSQAMQQKIILYLIPAMLLFSGTLFPIGVLFYWLTTNLWSMGQQFFVLRRMPPVVPLATGAAAARASSGAGAKPGGPGRQTRVSESQQKKGSGSRGQGQPEQGQAGQPASDGQAPGGQTSAGSRGRPVPPAEPVQRPPAPSVAAAPARRPTGSRPAKRRGKGQRRGGRH